MIAPINKVRGEGNCGRVTDRGKEACECVRKYRPVFAAGRILTSAARLRTGTSSQAGVAKRVSTTSRSRSQTATQVNFELVQRQITLLSGETCPAPRSKACLKVRNGPAQTGPGATGVSSGRSTASRSPIETGRAKRWIARRSHRSARRERPPLHPKRPQVHGPERDAPRRRGTRSQP